VRPYPLLLILRIAHTPNLRLVSLAASHQVPFGELRSVTHIQPELQARCNSRMTRRSVRHHEDLAAFDGLYSRSVTAPKEALLTSLEYLAKAPRRA
jgi:hypothetical protein